LKSLTIAEKTNTMNYSSKIPLTFFNCHNYTPITMLWYRGPNLHTILQMGPHKGLVERNKHFMFTRYNISLRYHTKIPYV
jgi:hypothetical protein